MANPPRTNRMDLAASAEQSLLPFSGPISARPDRTTPVSAARQSRKSSRSIEPHILAGLSDVSRVLFLDVETTGLSRHYDELTLVGWLFEGVYRVHVAGDDPHPPLSSLRTASALCTFNRTLFGLAFLSKTI